MRVGLTYDLRDDYRALGFAEEAVAEFDSPETISGIESALWALGYTVDRIGHIRQLAARLAAGETWDLVFNIAEGVYGRSREAQVPALLEAYDIPYVFSDPLTHAVGLDKAIAKRLVRDAGLPTADFLLIEADADAVGCDLSFPLFVKPVAEGTGKGCTLASKVYGHHELIAHSRELRLRFGQPAIAEPYLPGREFTVGIVGNGARAAALGVMEVVLGKEAEPGVYSFTNKAYYEGRVRYHLVDDAEARMAAESALAVYRTLGCRDAARLDFRSDAHCVPQFLEVNTLAGLNPRHSDLPIMARLAGMPYGELIRHIVEAAVDRYSDRLGPRSRRSDQP